MARDTTPSPSTAVRTPPAPRLGFNDDYHPFSLSRKATAVTCDEERLANRTPYSSPSPSRRRSEPCLATSLVSKTTFRQSVTTTAWPAPSPQKRRHPASESLCPSASGILTAEGTAKAAASLGLKPAAERAKEVKNSTLFEGHAFGMLPTPAKTPQKPPNDYTAARINDFARKLFATQGSDLGEPRKRRPINYEMDAMEDEAIEIFNDEGPLPTKDLSVDNPFYGKKAPLEPVKRKGPGKLVSVPGEATQTFDDAANRTDGMIFVFRGKKIFRKFSEHDETAEEQEASDSEYGSLSKPLSHSSIKPQLLFPKQEQDQEEEEAVTDVEDMYLVEDELEPPQTPIKAAPSKSQTPDAPKYAAPMSPPQTRRTTRVTDKLGSKRPSRASSARRGSPFDSWQRTKDYKDFPLEKRQGDSLTPVTAKRTRS